jgi:hypothetical protein
MIDIYLLDVKSKSGWAEADLEGVIESRLQNFKIVKRRCYRCR